MSCLLLALRVFIFFNDTATTEIYTLSLHDALPISMSAALRQGRSAMMLVPEIALTPVFSRRLRAHFGDSVAIFHSSLTTDRKSTRLNSSHANISYAVFCLKKKTQIPQI